MAIYEAGFHLVKDPGDTEMDSLPVAQETVASQADEFVKCVLVTPFQTWVAESANDAARTERGDRMAFTDSNTINNSGTDVATSLGCFQQYRESGVLADDR